MLDNSSSDVLVKRHREGFVIFTAELFVVVFADLFDHCSVEFITKRCNKFVALRVWLAKIFAYLTVHPGINRNLNLFIR
ncbi:hypothetical protein D3C72_1568600 [compost metagenome]